MLSKSSEGMAIILLIMCSHGQSEKARLQAEAKAAEDARRRAEAKVEAEAKRKRELEREAARQALQKVKDSILGLYLFVRITV